MTQKQIAAKRARKEQRRKKVSAGHANHHSSPPSDFWQSPMAKDMLGMPGGYGVKRDRAV